MTYNFSAGPSMMPIQVLEEAQKEFLNYCDTGMSVMELNHRSELFNNIIAEAQADFKEITGMPDEYEIMFLQGGASLQFAAIPMNLMKNRKIGMVMTGHWTKKAAEDAEKHGKVIQLASSENENYSYIPDCKDVVLPNDIDYVHICENNTIYGTQYKKIPSTLGNSIVSDMSSCILSEPIDFSRYGLIFAGAQKNIGPAGVTVVVIRRDLVSDDVLPYTPEVMKYKNQIDNNCRYNTPPTYGIYLCGKTFKWIKSMGGLTAMKEINDEKARIIYEYIDQSKLFHGTAKMEHRSKMNATFTTGNSELDMDIVEDSKKHGFVSLKGHRFVGGLRATLYNAIPVENVIALVDYLKKYEYEYYKN